MIKEFTIAEAGSIASPHIFPLEGQQRILYGDFDEHQNATVVCSAVTIQQMMIYCVRVTQTGNTIATPTLSALVNKMESLDYYKFWFWGTEEELNSLSTHFNSDSVLSRYTWYDEDMILANTKSIHSAYNLNRPIRDVDVLVRIYVLDQYNRVEKFKLLNIPDYQGTCLDKILR